MKLMKGITLLTIKKIIFINYSAFGHINPELAIGSILKKHGYKIYFASYSVMREYVVKQGYNFYQLNTYPFGFGYEDELNKNSLDRKLDALIDRFKDRIYNQRKKELLKMVSELKFHNQ